MSGPALLWLRRDLRRRDHPALLEAAQQAGPAGVAVVFVIEPTLWDGGGAARRAWLAATLESLRNQYDDRLVLRTGDPVEVIPRLLTELKASSVHVTRETTPYGRRRDAAVKRALDVPMVQSGTPYAVGPGLVTTQQGGPYQVFTPFRRAWRDHGWPAPAPEPTDLHLLTVDSDENAWEMVRSAIDAAPTALPEAGEDAALQRWQDFREEALADYDEARDAPAVDGTSRLSPYLKLGVVHPRTLLADLAAERSPGAETFVSELAWREFYADVLWHHPRSVWHDLKDGLARMPYDDPDDRVDAWREGRTGYPLVDAGMRQLLETGWMHNRLRMITASFFTKDLHQWWPAGARHFLDHLIDGDLASNNHGWQWVAGTGTDAAPYFRVFNPVTQGLKIDPHGDYVRRWIPELRHLAGRAAHEPWKHDDGYAHGYPVPIVDHGEERAEALRRYERARGKA